MEISQEAILAALTEAGGQVRNADLLSRFRGALNCSDPLEKKRNRELFKAFVNNVAVVKELEEAKYIVLKKKYQHLLPLYGDGRAQEMEKEEDPQEKSGPRPAREDNQEDYQAGEEEAKAPCPNEPEEPEGDSSKEPSPIELAFARVKNVDVKAKRSLRFVVPLKPSEDLTHQQGSVGPTASPMGSEKTQASTHKRFALPLRMPPVVITPCPEEKAPLRMPPVVITPCPEEKAPSRMPPVVITPPCPGEKAPKEQVVPSRLKLEPPSSPRYKRRQSPDSVAGTSSPQTRRLCKTARPAEEPKFSETFPIESTEHEWLVSAAMGRWGLLYGHLLNDTHLAERKDFITGFTALHWAAKCGNSDMVCKIIELSRQKGKGVDVNAKSFAGYTPLHIAAIHDQKYIMELLVRRYEVDHKIRDNSGKKALHYLPKSVSAEFRELLGAPRAKAQDPELQKNSEEPEVHRHSHTISRLFQPSPAGLRKKPKTRGSFLSVAEEPRGERDEHSSSMHRLLSDAFS